MAAQSLVRPSALLTMADRMNKELGGLLDEVCLMEPNARQKWIREYVEGRIHFPTLLRQRLAARRGNGKGTWVDRIMYKSHN